MAYCGINCYECQAYVATENKDAGALKEVAQRWGGYDNQIYTIEDIRCTGCKSSTLNRHCHGCRVRTCGIEKGLQDCGECSEFICDKLRDEWSTWHDFEPNIARRILEKT